MSEQALLPGQEGMSLYAYDFAAPLAGTGDPTGRIGLVSQAPNRKCKALFASRRTARTSISWQGGRLLAPTPKDTCRKRARTTCMSTSPIPRTPARPMSCSSPRCSRRQPKPKGLHGRKTSKRRHLPRRSNSGKATAPSVRKLLLHWRSRSRPGTTEVGARLLRHR